MVHEFAFRDADFRHIAQLVHSHMGIMLPEQKKEMVYARLARRLRTLGLSDFGSYLKRLEDPAELEMLANAMTTNVTAFFREPHHFHHLAETVLPQAAAQNKNRRLRIWSAGCSAGMEAYSIAMTVLTHLPNAKQWDVKILATDIDTAILERGKKGDYDAHQWDKIPETCRGTLARLQANGTMSVSDDVKKLVCFKHLNLLEDWPMQGPFDAIFCRNVVIYFDKETQRHLFARMADLLKPQGWLYIGHSENLHYVSDRFTLLGSTIYRLNDHE